MASEAVTYSVKLPARTLQAVPKSSSNIQSRWLVGTTSLREENELRLLEYDAAQDKLNTVSSWVHGEEVWDAACCPGQPQKIVTVHCKRGVYGTTLWQADGSSSQLVPLMQLQQGGVIRRAMWSQLEQNKLLTVEEGAVKIWDITGSTAGPSTSSSPGGSEQFWTAALHPKDPKLALVAAGSSVQLWDASSLSRASEVPATHKMPVRDVSWAPNNEHRFVSAGDDGKLRFWDTRMLSQPLLELSGHTHWVWCCLYNPYHDQLLLSSSTDTTVCVWFTPTLAKTKGVDVKQASRPGGHSSRQESNDGKAHTYDEHEDSVYGLAWSAVDAWLFASMSYDGRLVVHKVPKNVKYKVLI